METRQPNVLLVTVDQWPGSLLGIEDRKVITPTLDRLASTGTRFARTYSECPVCIPARRSLMTGTTARTHGDREFKPAEPMPDLPTLAQTFRNAGYQAYAVGKLHIYPQRNRIGFDDVLLMEEGRSQLGTVDDYEVFLAEQGFPGQQYGHGMSPNDYQWRPWHLPELCHPTNWASQQMSKMIKRRDTTRPAFWYLSYASPHPPMVPAQAYLDMYRDREPDLPVVGEWADGDDLPYALRSVRRQWPDLSPQDLADARRAFYATCTQIDHQLRLVIGTLREEQVLDDTIIMFTSDHGDMLGDHLLWSKRLFYESSARVPMILAGTTHDRRVAIDAVDPRLVELRDVMPTLLDLAGIPIPDDVEGLSMVGDTRRERLYGEFGTGATASRMITDDRYKLIYYPAGNHRQLFDLEHDPGELIDRSGSPEYRDVLAKLSALLREELYGSDLSWIRAGEFVGAAEPAALPRRDRGLAGNRGVQYPPPPLDSEPERVVGLPDTGSTSTTSG